VKTSPIKKSIIAMFGTFLVTGCVSLQSISLTPIPAKRTNQVSATTSKTVFLGFNFDNDYVDNLTDQLRAKCQDGYVKGILTKDEVTSYLIVFKRTITATGYCLKS